MKGSQRHAQRDVRFPPMPECCRCDVENNALGRSCLSRTCPFISCHCTSAHIDNMLNSDMATIAIAAIVRARSLEEVAELLVEKSDLASVFDQQRPASSPLQIYEYTSTSAPVIGNILRKASHRGIGGHVSFTIGKGNGSFSVDAAVSVNQLQKVYDALKTPCTAVTVVPSTCSLAPQSWSASFFDSMCINLSLPFVVDDDRVLSCKVPPLHLVSRLSIP